VRDIPRSIAKFQFHIGAIIRTGLSQGGGPLSEFQFHIGAIISSWPSCPSPPLSGFNSILVQL